MKLITMLYQEVMALSIIGSYVIVFLLFVRLLMSRLPRLYSYLLWGIVFLRLCCPVFPELGFHLIPSGLVEFAGQSPVAGERDGMPLKGNQEADCKKPEEALNQAVWQEAAGRDQIGLEGAGPETAGRSRGELEAAVQEAAGRDRAGLAAVTSEAAGKRADSRLGALALVWLAGVFAAAGYHIFCYGRLKRRVRTAREVEPGVRELEGEHLSFVMGIVRPIIYLSRGLPPESRRVVLCHEQVHLRRRDYLLKPLALGICCVHWFNPLVWLSFCLMSRDCEMSCDERVVRLLGSGSKKAYAYALLEAAAGETGRIYKKSGVCALLSFGETEVKKRISHILHYRRVSGLTAAVGAVIVALLALGLFSQPEQGEEIFPEEKKKEQETLEEEVLNRFAEAFVERDGAALYELSFDKESFQAWDMVTTIQGAGKNGEKDEEVYVFGYSSPWAESYSITREEGSDEARIRFILTNSVPEYYIGEELVCLTWKDGRCYADHVEYKQYDKIESREELGEVFDLEAEVSFDSGSTGYGPEFTSAILHHIEEATNPAYYSAYQNPVTAAERLLHLTGGTGEVTEVLHESEGHRPVGHADEAFLYGEGTVVNVRYVFERDDSFADIPMIMAEESRGMWMLAGCMEE